MMEIESETDGCPRTTGWDDAQKDVKSFGLYWENAQVWILVEEEN